MIHAFIFIVRLMKDNRFHSHLLRYVNMFKNATARVLKYEPITAICSFLHVSVIITDKPHFLCARCAVLLISFGFLLLW